MTGNELTLASAFLVGLLGSTHCIGMCGGIVGALTFGIDERLRQRPAALLPYLLTYNTGRILSYVIAGTIAGLLGARVQGTFSLGGYPMGAVVGGLFMILLGLYLMGWTAMLGWLERLGGHLWKRLQPLGKRFLPVRSVGQALPLGLVWGWLPCGMVYSVLAFAMTTSSPGQGAATMLAFGIGTLPMLLAMGAAADRLEAFTRSVLVRRLAAGLVIAFGIFTLFKPMLMMGGHAHHM